MASNYTSNYKLCQWEATDKVLRTEFNSDNAKIDAALGSLASSVSGKASASTVSSLQSTVNDLKTSKADKSITDSLSVVAGQHTVALGKKGNCQLYTTVYIGTGKHGSSSPNSLTFPHKPFAVFIVAGNYSVPLFQGVDSTVGVSSSAYLTVSWSGNTVKWYNASSEIDQLNQQGGIYQVFALLEL